MIRIKSFKAGFRRCGIAHPAEWMEYEDDHFSEDELERLKDEAMLEVEVVADSESKDVADDQSQSTDSADPAAATAKDSASKKSAAKA
jgi:hypothetical protein